MGFSQIVLHLRASFVEFASFYHFTFKLISLLGIIFCAGSAQRSLQKISSTAISDIRSPYLFKLGLLRDLSRYGALRLSFCRC